MNVHARINARAAEHRRRSIDLHGSRSRWTTAERLAEIESIPLARYAMDDADNRCCGAVNREHDGKRWIEHLTRLGWRIAGTSHDIAKQAGSRRVDHRGWFISPHGDGETIHGVVIRLPAKRGRNRYLVGQSDPFNDDCYLVAADLHEANRQDSGEYENDLLDLACSADRMAEISAEAEREYQEASDRLAEAKEAMSEAASEVLESLGKMRDHKATGIANPDAYEVDACDLDHALERYREKRDAAMDALRDAKRWHGIGWRDV